MKAFIRKLFSLISAGEFIGVLAFCSIAAILEGYSVYHLSKFVGFVVSVPENNSEDWYTVRVLSYMYNSFGELFFIIFTLSVVIITSIISAMTVFQITKFVSFRGIQVSNDVISNIISYPHVHQGITRDSLSSTISFEIERFTLQVLLPIFQLISKGSILFAITAVVLIQYPSQTIVLIAIFTLYYVLIYLILRPQLEKNGANISKFLEFRIKIASAIFNNYRFLYSSKKFDFLFSEFKLTGSAQASAQARIQFLSQISRFILEIIIFGTIIVYLAWNSRNYNEETPQLLATIGFAAFKLFPTMQSLFTNLTTIRGNYESINRLLNYKNLSTFADKPCESEILLSSQVNSLCVKIKRGTIVNSVQFNDFEFCFKQGKLYALTGMSGVGKSTFLDLISTYRNVENIVIKKPGSSNISYLPQTSEIAPFGIVENVALSYPDEADRGEVFKILSALGISNKLKISAGISGGQLQRLSIARALFNRPDILIMDEPTSALDSDNVSLVKSLLLEELKYGATIILVTHQKDLCDIADCILNFQRSQGLVNIQIQEAVN